MDIEASPREWIIRKGSFYYRPDRAGYTGLKAAAGRYTQAEAEREAAVEPGHIVAVHQDRVPDDPVPASEAATTITALRKRVEELEGAATTHQRTLEALREAEKALEQARLYIERDEAAHGRQFGDGNAVRAALARIKEANDAQR